jgi:dihydrodipicolinate synthase/N-acetylneuraminate lyase
MLLEGIFLPLTTPFRPDGRLFPHKLQTNVARYSLTPAAGMLVLSQDGEADSLTDQDAREVLASAIAAAQDEKVMLAGVGRESVSATLDRIESAAAAGYDAAVLRGPAFTADPALRPEVLAFFHAVADRSPLPLIVHSTHERALGYERIAELAQHPNVIGSLNARATSDRVRRLVELTSSVSREVTVTPIFAAVTRRMARNSSAEPNFVSAASLGGSTAVLVPAAPARKTRTRKVGFQVLAGDASTMLETWQAGAAGAVPRLGACAPQACCEVFQAHKDGDPALAAEKQERVRLASACFEGEADGLRYRGIARLKYGCDLNAYFGGSPRLPLLPLTAADRTAVEQALSGIHN